MPATKRNTLWYDDLCSLYQKTRDLGLKEASSGLRNILWEQVRSFVHGRVYSFVSERKASILRKDPDLSVRLYQDSFLIFQKACDRWDCTRKTKFMTFLGDILDQEILNLIRMDLYRKNRDKKLAVKVVNEQSVSEKDNGEVDFEKEELLQEVRVLLENFSFETELERDIIFTTLYGKVGDWSRLQKKSGLGIGVFYKVRAGITQKLREHITNSCSDKMKAVLKEVLAEK